MKYAAKRAMLMAAEEYADKRDAALITFVRTDDDTEIRALLRSVGTPIPRSKKAFHGGLYKAVRYCTRIPEDVKAMAWEKCRQLGLVPYIAEFETAEGLCSGAAQGGAEPDG